jgi:multiple sugar transport system permease protein
MSPRMHARLEWVAVHTFAVAATLFFVLPFVFVALTAVMTDEQSLTRDLWPNPFQWHNLVDVWDTPGFGTWWRNTLVYAVAGTALTLVSSIPVAYALAHFKFRGRQLAMMMVIATMMLPPQVVIIPMYLVWAKQLHLSGTLWPLIIPLAFGDAFSIFLLRQFFLSIPEEYLDAARVDGCGEFRILTTVVVRLAKPAIAAVALFSVLYCFNDFFLPLLYVGENPDNWVVQIGLSQFRSLHQVQWNLVMAATILVMLPVIVLFFLAQRAFVEGVTLTGVKG